MPTLVKNIGLCEAIRHNLGLIVRREHVSRADIHDLLLYRSILNVYILRLHVCMCVYTLNNIKL